ncbi:hypothetical protein [Castellaniella caeni]|uniref:hypothetical protein n=1 Tax=Castellaniella caeni TaxID=266123 RepID=UPI0011AF976A|nr:hypothetical protein [Castellaniella caeni]
MEEKELIAALADQLHQTQEKLLAVEGAMEMLLQVSPLEQRRQFVAAYRAFADGVLSAADDQPMSDQMQASLTLAINAYLEAAGQPPGRPGTR